jgi:hypothetical protein
MGIFCDWQTPHGTSPKCVATRSCTTVRMQAIPALWQNEPNVHNATAPAADDWIARSILACWPRPASASPCADGVPLINNPRHPTVIEDTWMTLQRLKALKRPDLFLHNHHQNLGRPPSIRGAIPAWTPKHLQTCWPGQKRTSQNRSARQKRRNSAHQRPFYFGATNRTSRYVMVRCRG